MRDQIAQLQAELRGVWDSATLADRGILAAAAIVVLAGVLGAIALRSDNKPLELQTVSPDEFPSVDVEDSEAWSPLTEMGAAVYALDPTSTTVLSSRVNNPLRSGIWNLRSFSEPFQIPSLWRPGTIDLSHMTSNSTS